MCRVIEYERYKLGRSLYKASRAKCQRVIREKYWSFKVSYMHNGSQVNGRMSDSFLSIEVVGFLG